MTRVSVLHSSYHDLERPTASIDIKRASTVLDTWKPSTSTDLLDRPTVLFFQISNRLGNEQHISVVQSSRTHKLLQYSIRLILVQVARNSRPSQYSFTTQNWLKYVPYSVIVLIASYSNGEPCIILIESKASPAVTGQ